MIDTPTSHVLVLDHNPECEDETARLLASRNLTIVRYVRERLGSLLRSNIELSAIILSERYAASAEDTARLAAKIHSLRPEIPIVLRLDPSRSQEELPEAMRRVVCASYLRDDMPRLEAILDEYIFTLVYPNSLVRGIGEITQSALRSQFGLDEVGLAAPYIARDRIIFGQVLTLIPLESAWCRGYMMLQIDETPLLEHLAIVHADSEATFRTVNSVLSETTNLIWGALKNRFIGDESPPRSSHVQVPLVINHHHSYISFGTEKPQLCFTYDLHGLRSARAVRMYQRFVFNLNWSPEEFREIEPAGGDAIDSGELELF